MNDLTTISGFFKTYYSLLPIFRTQLDCFDYLNKELEYINGFKMFKDYNDFKQSIYR